MDLLCTECAKVFAKEVDLIAHQARATDTRHLTCTECQAFLVGKDQHRNHMRQHTRKEKSLSLRTCTLCPYETRFKYWTSWQCRCGRLGGYAIWPFDQRSLDFWTFKWFVANGIYAKLFTPSFFGIRLECICQGCQRFETSVFFSDMETIFHTQDKPLLLLAFFPLRCVLWLCVHSDYV